jgi:hypothetical protein
MVDFKMVKKPFELHLLEDNTNTSDNAAAISDDMVSCRKYHVSTRSCDVPREGVQLQIVLLREILQLFAYYLALNR